MDQSGKVLKFVFIILILVFIGQVGYLLYSSRLPSKSEGAGDQAALSDSDKSLPALDSQNPEQAIQPKVLQNLVNLKKDLLITSELVNHYQGEIIEVDRSDNGLMLKLKALGSENINTVYFNENEVYLISFNKSNYERTEINDGKIEDLEVGQFILMEERLDLLEDADKALASVIITYISKE